VSVIRWLFTLAFGGALAFIVGSASLVTALLLLLLWAGASIVARQA
jgi:hypothetical protein